MSIGSFNVKLLGFAAWGVFVTLAACSSSAKTFCDAQQQCSGGNDKDVAACVELRDGARDVAKVYDCLDSFDKLRDCTETKSSCQNKSYQSGTSCQAEAAAYGACEKAASAKKLGL
jgi:hypothetical protein